MKICNIFILFLLIVLFHCVICFADNKGGVLGIGFGYPYFSLKYGISDETSIEGRYAFGTGINVYGGRLYYNFNPQNTVVCYFGIEGNYITFNKSEDTIAGNGNAFEVFLGGEIFLKKTLSLNMDLGLCYSRLTEQTYSLSAEGSDYLLNIGVNIYFH